MLSIKTSSEPNTPRPKTTDGIASVTAGIEKKNRVRDKAISAYKNELHTPEKYDLGIITFIFLYNIIQLIIT